MKAIFYICILLIAISCVRSTKKEQSYHTIEVVDTVQVTTPEPQQSANCILGDKLIWYDTTDVNGLKSPDSLYLVAVFKDSSAAVKFIKKQNDALAVLNLKNYYYVNKPIGFLVYDKTKPKIESWPVNIYRIRPHNFDDDKHFSPKSLDSIYRYYDVVCIKKDSLYLVKPKKLYNDARLFTRLITYQADKQVANITINDFESTNIIETSNGYLVGLNNFDHGTSRLFTNTGYSIKVLWLNKKLKILKEYHFRLRSTHLIHVNLKGPHFIARFEYHASCDGCLDYLSIYDVVFDEQFNIIDLEVVKHGLGLWEKSELLKHLKSFTQQAKPTLH